MAAITWPHKIQNGGAREIQKRIVDNKIHYFIPGNCAYLKGAVSPTLVSLWMAKKKNIESMKSLK